MRESDFFWKDMRTVVQLLDTVYKKGVKVCGDEKVQLERRRTAMLIFFTVAGYNNPP